MHSVSRTAIFAKIHKVLKKSYKPVALPAERTVLEHLLFACVLEDAHDEPAEEAFAALKHTFYDWNEVRADVDFRIVGGDGGPPRPRAAANRIKRVLHSIFEEFYCFDLEDKRKKNLGPTVKWLEKMDGTSRFVVAYVVQAALGGHSIPVDAGTLAVLRVLELVSEKDAAAGEVPGMERAVSKSKGVEFGSLLHQLGADPLANPFRRKFARSSAIDPKASKRFPQRRQPRPEPPRPRRSPLPPRPAPPPPAATGRKKKAEPAAPSQRRQNPRRPRARLPRARRNLRLKASRWKARLPKRSRRKASPSKPRRRLLRRARKRLKPCTNRGPQRSRTRNNLRSRTRNSLRSRTRSNLRNSTTSPPSLRRPIEARNKSKAEKPAAREDREATGGGEDPARHGWSWQTQTPVDVHA